MSRVATFTYLLGSLSLLLAAAEIFASRIGAAA